MDNQTLQSESNQISEDREIFNRLNKLARQFYKVLGYEVREGFDFSSARHSRERMCYRMAELAFEEFIGYTPEDLDLEDE
jgi:hypothetical protein